MSPALAAALLLAASGPARAAQAVLEAPAAPVLSAPARPEASPLPRGWSHPAAGFSPLAGLTLDRPLPPVVPRAPGAAPLPAPAGVRPAPAAGPALREAVRLEERAAPVFEGAGTPPAGATPAGGREGDAAAPLPPSRRGPPEPGEERSEPPRRPGAGFALRAAAAAGLSAGAAYPWLMDQRPLQALAVTLAVAWAAALGLELAWDSWRLLRRLLEGPAERPARGRLARALTGMGAASTGLALGLGLGLGADSMRAPALQAGASVYAPEAGLSVLGGDLGLALAARLSENPEGRATLALLRDRRGELRLPHAFLGEVGSREELRYFSALDALVVSRRALEARGWSAEEFERAPWLQERLARELWAEGARELFRAAQARRGLFHLMEEGRGLTGGLMEAEYEAALSKHRAVHEALKGGAGETLREEDLAEYEALLEDLRGALARLDSEPRHAGYRRQRLPRYSALLMRARMDWPEHAAEGWALLARRAQDPAARRAYLGKARASGLDAGLVPPGFEDLP